MHLSRCVSCPKEDRWLCSASLNADIMCVCVSARVHVLSAADLRRTGGCVVCKSERRGCGHNVCVYLCVCMCVVVVAVLLSLSHTHALTLLHMYPKIPLAPAFL